jgi:type I restriction-modification system DNA methylase subunit
VISDYIAQVQKKYATGDATEHSYRSALEFLFENAAEGVSALNEPKRVKCGAPDFIINRRNIAVGHVEAKDIGVDLKKLTGANLEQKKRYLKALPNLVYTNCLDFEFYRNGALIASISIAEPLMGIQLKPENFAPLEAMIKDFLSQKPQTITSSRKLAEIMAGKAVLIKDILARLLQSDESQITEIAGQYKEFQKQLIHDLSIEDFADIYAETIAYGMFAARLHDDTPGTFTRQEALDLLPKSNPFLRNLFSYIAGPNLDDSIRWIIDDLADVFQACDLFSLMKDFGKLTGRNDPFLHFYEDFLASYNPKKRKARGVWYTPEPVVNFIVRAVDDILQSEFGLPMGLADTSKVTIDDWDTGQGKKTKKQVHRVQILDPATGTGTFLAEVIKQIAPKVKNVAEGMWSSYIEKDLIPRIHGFELLMASYAMCHMKLDMILTELGYKPSGVPPRLSVYLTNSLEEGDAANYELPFAQWLSNEVQQANTIKRDMPIMCVIGNPPYSGESVNKGPWISDLMKAYKFEPGGKQKLQERNPKWINKDEHKFIRLAEHLIEKNNDGILGFITSHGYLGDPTLRGMRWHLLKTFDKIYVLDLHGNANKKEVSPNGSLDKNVFEIKQGVALIIAVKKKAAKGGPLAQVFHHELWGDRKGKYDELWKGSLSTVAWTSIQNHAPHYAFVARDFEQETVYKKGFSLQDFMPVNSVGIVTARDALTIDMDKETLWRRVQDFPRLDVEALRQKYKLGEDVRDWAVAFAKKDVIENFSPDLLIPIQYRPFDTRWTYYTGHSKGFHCYPRHEVMRHIAFKKNFSFAIPKQSKDGIGALVSKYIAGHKVYGAYDINTIFPLYLYPSDNDLDQTRRVNFEPAIHKKIIKASIHLQHGTPDEIAIFDYIYGVLHCPAYRQTYKEFLKIDFPRIPYPASPELFWDITAKGSQLRHLHLMEPAAIGTALYPFKGDGDTVVLKPERRADGSVYINATQYFADVPEIAWNFYIGGYQPAQKWLKDRKGRALNFDDVQHYQKIIKVLSETDRVMQTIEMPLG